MSFLLVSLDIIKMTKNVISGCVWVEGVVSALPPRKYLVIRHRILKQYRCVCTSGVVSAFPPRKYLIPIRYYNFYFSLPVLFY